MSARSASTFSKDMHWTRSGDSRQRARQLAVVLLQTGKVAPGSSPRRVGSASVRAWALLGRTVSGTERTML